MKLATWKDESPVSSQSIASIPTTLNNEPMWYDVTRWPGIGGSVNSVAEVRALQRYPSWHKHFDKIRCHSRQTIPVIQIYTPIDCSQATTCSSDSTDTHGATHHRLIAGTQRDRMCDNTRNFYVVVQRANRKLSFQNFLTFVAKEGTKRMITNNTNNTYICQHVLSWWWLIFQVIASPSFTEVERSLWQWLSIAGMIWWDHSMTMWTYKYTQWRRSKRKLCINLAMVARCQEWHPMKHGIQMALAALSSSVLIV